MKIKEDVIHQTTYVVKDDMTIGERIKFHRDSKDMTQKRLSEITGISEISIRKYEAGDRNPKIEQLRSIEKALDLEVSVSVFYDLDISKVGDIMTLLLMIAESTSIEFVKLNDYVSLKFKDPNMQIMLANWANQSIQNNV